MAPSPDLAGLTPDELVEARGILTDRVLALLEHASRSLDPDELDTDQRRTTVLRTGKWLVDLALGYRP